MKSVDESRAEPEGREPRAAGARRRLVVVVAVVALAAIAGAVVVVVAGDDSPSTVSSPPATGADDGWTRLPDPPLSPRVAASAAWTGSEVVVAGGWEVLCPPGADCAAPPEAPFTDGAAFDPVAGTWRPIADAPVAFQGVRPAVVEGKVFLLVDCAVAGIAPDGEVAEERCPGSDDPVVLLRYDPAADVWAQLPGPPDGRTYALEAVGSDLVAYATSHERGRVADWRFVTATQTWSELPEDPLPRMFDRSIVAADGGRSVLLVGARLGSESSPGDVPNLAARLDLTSMTWSELPPSPSRGFRAWGVGDRVVLEPHFGGTGGLFDPGSGTWSDLPGAASAPYDPNGVAGAVGPDDAVYVEASGWVFDLGANRWIEVAPVDDRSVFPPSSVTAIGRDLFVFGGERWPSSEGDFALVGGDDGELLGDAWLWHPPDPG